MTVERAVVLAILVALFLIVLVILLRYVPA